MSMLVTPPVPLPLALANGGSGSGTAAGARTAFGLDTPAETTLTLATGWSSVRTPAYRKLFTGWVQLQGMATGDGTATTLIATLPAGYRPPLRRFFAVIANTAFGEIFVEPDGTINVAVGSTTGNFALDQIGFFV